MREINRIICHCTATPEGRSQTVADIKRMHIQDNHWSHIGYHYLIYLDGSIHNCLDESIPGIHCSGYNKHSIAVCYVGGCAADGKLTAKDTRTPEQKEAFVKILTQLHKRYPAATLHGHREFAAKDCPSFDIHEYDYLFK